MYNENVARDIVLTIPHRGRKQYVFTVISFNITESLQFPIGDENLISSSISTIPVTLTIPHRGRIPSYHRPIQSCFLAYNSP